MREILFRGKRKDNEEWVCGNLFVNSNDGRFFILIDGDIEEDFTAEEVIHETVGQWTGLMDKNGVKIFAGDIFHIGDKNIRYKVVYRDTGLIGKAIKASDYVGLCYWKDVIEIIGNIHDNPAKGDAK